MRRECAWQRQGERNPRLGVRGGGGGWGRGGMSSEGDRRFAGTDVDRGGDDDFGAELIIASNVLTFWRSITTSSLNKATLLFSTGSYTHAVLDLTHRSHAGQGDVNRGGIMKFRSAVQRRPFGNRCISAAWTNLGHAYALRSDVRSNDQLVWAQPRFLGELEYTEGVQEFGTDEDTLHARRPRELCGAIGDRETRDFSETTDRMAWLPYSINCSAPRGPRPKVLCPLLRSAITLETFSIIYRIVRNGISDAQLWRFHWICAPDRAIAKVVRSRHCYTRGAPWIQGQCDSGIRQGSRLSPSRLTLIHLE
ncbi:hypothetical protein AG1IA_00730 [Rhizoctonia solani AG-1 IA]|uniref:Uncharacterized protein n=1 Tax=Thanatephorus cucumeris (strain AG1-IA) TaxID=983506 RepID=L8X9A7_THACA|nr:hypothetical protein AG1IA_00730 [Rhizoctonia solani AG-1 IA]